MFWVYDTRILPNQPRDNETTYNCKFVVIVIWGLHFLPNQPRDNDTSIIEIWGNCVT